MIDVEHRLIDLESVFGRFLLENEKARIERDREMKLFQSEMKEFKDEMKEFKDEMKEFKDEMKEFKDEMKEFKDEMRRITDKNSRDLQDYKDENAREFKKMNKKWGELANKWGTFAEDIIAPGVKPILAKYFKTDIHSLYVNVKKYEKKNKLKDEFDVIAVSDDKVFLVETKSRPRKSDITELLTKRQVFRDLFPEYKDLNLILMLGALRFDDEFLEASAKENIYLIAYREWEYLDILNFDLVKKYQ